MTEREKAEAGYLYNPYEKELVEERAVCVAQTKRNSAVSTLWSLGRGVALPHKS